MLVGLRGLFAGIVVLSAALESGCDSAEGVASNERGAPPKSAVSDDLQSLARSLAGDDVRVLSVYDREGSRFALGVERGDAAAEAHTPKAGTDAVPALLLLVIDSAAKTAKWPIGAGRALDAALSSNPDVVGFLDDAARPCVSAGWAPSCASVTALPLGLDVSADGRVVFSAVDGVATHLFVVSQGSATPKRLTKGLDQHSRALFSPDGQSVAFVGSSGGLSALFSVSVGSGAVTQLTNVGLELGPPGSADRMPQGFVPPPLARASMHWDSNGIHYASLDKAFRVDPVKGGASEEGVVR